MNSNLKSLWSGFSASIIGSGHIKRGLPCQDASTVVTGPRPALIVCDGRGSASRSQDGASAAVRDFTSQCAVFEPLLATILDADEANAGRWEQFCRILYRTLMQTKLNLSAEHNVPEKEFDFTVAAAVVGTNWIGCFQVGDGSIVLRQNGTPETAFLPDKGEFANQTHFLRENGEAKGKFHAKLFSAKENSGVAITSDGPEHLMFRLADMTPGMIFNRLFDDMQSRSLTKQDIMDYLTRREWDKDPRGQDDRSIAILAPELALQGIESAPAVFHNGETSASPVEEKMPPREQTSAISVKPQDKGETVTDKIDLKELRNETEWNSNAALAHASSEHRNTLISGSITGAAVITLLLSTVYYQSELKAMRQEQNMISAQQTIIAKRLDQHVDKPATEYLRQTPGSTIDGQTPGGTADNEENAYTEVDLDNIALAETNSSEMHSFLQQETEEHFLKDEESQCMAQDPSDSLFSEKQPENVMK